MSTFDDVLEEFVATHRLAVEELTQKQLADAILQIIASGDLVRYVQVNTDGQTVVYLPFAREQQLKARIEVLTAFLLKHNIPPPPSCLHPNAASSRPTLSSPR